MASKRNFKASRRGAALCIALALCSARWSWAQTDQGRASSPAEEFQAAMNGFVNAQQEALQSGDPERILRASAPVAAASLALLMNVDKAEQAKRLGAEALSLVQQHMMDVPTGLMLLRMELSLGEYEQATELKQHIVTSNREDVNLHITLARIFEQASRLDEAVGEAQRAAQMNPDSLEAQIVLGMSTWELNYFGYNEDTLRAFTKAQALDPNGFSANLLLATIESQYHQFEAAEKHLRIAMAADPSAPRPLYQLGTNAYEEGRLDEAAQSLGRYIELAKSSKDVEPKQERIALLTLDDIAEQQGRALDPSHAVEEAALLQKQAQSVEGDSKDLTAGSDTLPMGSTHEAERESSDKKQTPAATPEVIGQLRQMAAGALGNIGTVLANRSEYAAAVAPFKYANEEYPGMDAVVRNLGMVACISGAFEEGEAALKQVVTAHPDDTMARGCLGMAQFESEDYSNAASNFSALGSQLSSNPMFGASAAATYARVGDRNRAEQIMDSIASTSTDPQFQARRATAFLDLGRVDQAYENARTAAIGKGRTPAESLRVLGLIDLERHSLDKAISELRSEASLESAGGQDQFESEALLAEALIDSGAVSEAQKVTSSLMRSDPELPARLLASGKTLLKNGDVQAAFEKLAAAHALAPQDKVIRKTYESVKQSLGVSAR